MFAIGTVTVLVPYGHMRVLTASYSSRSSSLTVEVVHDGLVQGFRTEVRTVEFILRQLPKLGSQRFGVDLKGLIKRLPFGFLGDDARHGNRSPATQSFKPDVSESSFFHLYRYGRHVAADGVTDFSEAVKVFDPSSIARVAEMLLDQL